MSNQWGNSIVLQLHCRKLMTKINVIWQDPNFNHYRYKRSMGTPTSQMVSVKEGTPGAMLDRHGQLVVRAVDV